MSETSETSVYVDAWRLRQRFAELDILGQLERRELMAVVIKQWIAPAESGQPPGTLSQRVRYFSGKILVAVVHQYLLPNGRIGASGLPDPKWLRDGEVTLKYKPPEH
jgi:hypothetical protein